MGDVVSGSYEVGTSRKGDSEELITRDIYDLHRSDYNYKRITKKKPYILRLR